MNAGILDSKGSQELLLVHLCPDINWSRVNFLPTNCYSAVLFNRLGIILVMPDVLDRINTA